LSDEIRNCGFERGQTLRVFEFFFALCAFAGPILAGHSSWQSNSMTHTNPLAVSEQLPMLAASSWRWKRIDWSIASLEAAAKATLHTSKMKSFSTPPSASKASCVIVPANATLRRHAVSKPEEPKVDFALIAELLQPSKSALGSIHPTAVIAATAEVDESVYLGSTRRIEEYTRIGADTRIEAGVVVGATSTRQQVRPAIQTSCCMTESVLATA